MKSKGTQFEQLALFDKGPSTAHPLPAVVHSDTEPSNHKKFVQKFGSAPEGKFSWEQRDFPHSMPEREYGPSVGVSASSYQWAPTWNMETEQSGVSPGKFLDRFTGMNYNKSPNREGQEGRGYNDSPVTISYAGQASDGGDLHVLADGNHRITAERHRGAMFHRVKAYEGDPDNMPEQRRYLRPLTAMV